MNNQNILKYRGTKLDGILDYSELYDYELVDTSVDMVLDISEIYDYKLGNFEKDYVLIEHFATTQYIITEDEFLFITEDEYIIEYNE